MCNRQNDSSNNILPNPTIESFLEKIPRSTNIDSQDSNYIAAMQDHVIGAENAGNNHQDNEQLEAAANAGLNDALVEFIDYDNQQIEAQDAEDYILPVIENNHPENGPIQVGQDANDNVKIIIQIMNS